ELSPKEAEAAIRANRLTSPARISGRLDLTNFDREYLPSGLHCYELDARGSRLRALPADLKIDGRLVLDACSSLVNLPTGLSAGSISLRNCTSLRGLPEKLSTWFLDLTGCSQFEQWPAEGTIHHGALILRNCIGIRVLPAWIGRLSQLDLAGCVQLAQIPEGISVSSWVDIGGTPITSLPRSLQGASLRWRSVRVNERIAFRPEELTAKEALAESNAERRRVIIERMGYLRFAEESGAKTLDEDTDAGGLRQLLHIPLAGDEPLVGLTCRCPSTGRQYFLRVPPTMKTCRQAAAWVAGYDDPGRYHPKLET
ncbi:MAG TPA: hypothetical protein VJS65_13465, partial [Verrucomicrobiae bacterium]|nr:hypothetical protein [Verrucomicrobiae bacterium]